MPTLAVRIMQKLSKKMKMERNMEKTRVFLE